jgi:hypothetical protein
MRVGVMLGGFAGMVGGMQPVSMSDVRVMGGLFVVALRVMFSSFAVVSRSMLVVFSSFSVVFRSFVVVHRNFLFPGEMWEAGGVAGSARQSSRILDAIR